MRKTLFFALMCIASLTIVAACGNGNSSKNKSKTSSKDEASANVVNAEKDVKDMVGIEQSAYWLDKTFSLKLADVSPAFEYEALENGMDGCMGNSGGGIVSFVKKCM